MFAQNMGLGERFPGGMPVDLVWEVEHTFGLAGDPTAGARPEDPSWTCATGPIRGRRRASAAAG